MTDASICEPIDWHSPDILDGVRIGRAGARIVVEWARFGRLLWTEGEQMTFLPVPDVPAAQLEKFRATTLLACVRYLERKISLHGSAVQLAFGALALIGESGAGKSTTAMMLVENCGGKFLADDLVPVDWRSSVALIPPVNDSLWLNEDAVKWFGRRSTLAVKDAHPPRARAAVAEPLAAIVQLAFDDTLESSALIEPMNGREKFMLLCSAHPCYFTGDGDDAVWTFDARARLAEAIPFFRLRRRRSLQTLPVSTDLLSGLVGGLTS
jgi:hypothetical protein